MFLPVSAVIKVCVSYNAYWTHRAQMLHTHGRHANHSAFGRIIPHFRRFSAISHGICEILLFHSIHLSHKNLVFSYINL